MLKELARLIRKFEGCKLVAYLCPAGVWTIGWGATGKDVVKGLRWTQPQADARMRTDADTYMLAAAAISPILWFNEDIHSAVADFCYNLGTTRYKGSTLRKKIDKADWAGARAELAKWVFGGGRKLPGLVLRRHEESLLLPN